MPRFAANLSMLYPELDFLQRFDAAARDGFKGVEFLFPFAYEARELAARLKDNGLQQVLFNAPPGNWDSGERGLACLPGREAEFRDGIAKALGYAQALACPRVHVMAGLVPKGTQRESLRAGYVANLRWAAAEAAKQGIDLLIEPINTRDIPGFYLTKTQQALDIIQAVGSSNLWLQYDIYHMQVMEGDLGNTIEKNLAKIAHMQLADNPGRHEPGTGEINYEFLFKHIDKLGYQGWIGCEYKPAAETTAGLGWVKPHLK